MLDVALQRKFTQGCTDAGFGYAQAATAAYSQIASQMLEFWLQAMSGIADGLDSSQSTRPKASPAAKVAEAPFGFSPADWTPFAFLDSRRLEAAMGAGSFYGPMGMFMAMCSAVPLRGMPAAWPFAQAMINAGVPRDVAWPTAEANAAVIGAAEAATQGFQKVLVACQNGNGFASSLPRTAAPFDMQSLMANAPWPRLLH